ncbi:hypothetical protein BCF44_10860 [Kutzneria buriramensis]|uniref:Uncharacterized protein n=1 Tax=Kutzneria buriramensis TaxID=1045776 RepID=A0A3E0HFL4_9PSEU|nr:hypothetical protein BCF44_10860 [Kutzneria buriramensis]
MASRQSLTSSAPAATLHSTPTPRHKTEGFPHFVTAPRRRKVECETTRAGRVTHPQRATLRQLVFIHETLFCDFHASVTQRRSAYYRRSSHHPHPGTMPDPATLSTPRRNPRRRFPTTDNSPGRGPISRTPPGDPVKAAARYFRHTPKEESPFRPGTTVRAGPGRLPALPGPRLGRMRPAPGRDRRLARSNLPRGGRRPPTRRQPTVQRTPQGRRRPSTAPLRGPRSPYDWRALARARWARRFSRLPQTLVSCHTPLLFLERS